MKTRFAITALLLMHTVLPAQIKHKTMYLAGHWSHPKCPVTILPLAYDTNINITLLKTIDTLPKVVNAKVLGIKQKERVYYLAQPKDSTVPAISALKSSKFQMFLGGPQYWVCEYTDSGRMKRWLCYNKDYRLTGNYFEFYADWGKKVQGHYKEGHKVGKWYYFDNYKCVVRVEKYRKDGTLAEIEQRKPVWGHETLAKALSLNAHYVIR